MISESDSILVLLLFPLGMLVAVSYIAIAIYVAAVSFVLLFRFYKNKFTDEGYLTFTLPVKANQIFLSSALYILIWQIISGLVTAAAILMIIVFGTAQEGILSGELLDLSGAIINGFQDLSSDLGYSGYMVMNWIKGVVTIPAATIAMMASVTVGAVVAKRHKLLAAIGIYYGTTVALNTISGVISFFSMMLATVTENHIAVMLNVGTVLEILLQVGLLLGGYFLSTHLMKRKLNLP
jgi:DNA-binding transcriptional regulator YdaS (Cro superfamily)